MKLFVLSMSKLTLSYNNWLIESIYEGYQKDVKYFWEVI
jgi:hypothetical protein